MFIFTVNFKFVVTIKLLYLNRSWSWHCSTGGQSYSWLSDSRDGVECGPFLTYVAVVFMMFQSLCWPHSGQGHGTFGPSGSIGLLMGGLDL